MSAMYVSLTISFTRQKEEIWKVSRYRNLDFNINLLETISLLAQVRRRPSSVCYGPKASTVLVWVIVFHASHDALSLFVIYVWHVMIYRKYALFFRSFHASDSWWVLIVISCLFSYIYTCVYRFYGILHLSSVLNFPPQ